MNKTNIYKGIEAKNSLINGLNTIADTIARTYGAAGENALVESDLMPGYYFTNDAQSFVQEFWSDDPIENRAFTIGKEAVSRTDKESGDGRKTALLLMRAIFREGSKTGLKGMEIKRALDEMLPIMEKAIDSQARTVTEATVDQVAIISSESESIGHMIGDIWRSIGKDGFIEVEASRTYDTSYEVKEGIRLRGAAIMSPYLYTEDKKAIYKKPNILIARSKITTISDLKPILTKVAKEGKKELVLFVDEIDPAVAGALVSNHMRGIYKILLIKAPVLFKDIITEDFAKITGATIVEDGSGINWKNVGIEHLGTCDKLISDKEETTVLGIKDVTEHIEELKKRGEETDMLRVSWLTTKAAILKVGASTESELAYFRLKARDAINSSKLALEGGIVVGGGVALLNVSRAMPDTVGGNILREALQDPIKQQLINCGVSEFNLDAKEDFGDTKGFDGKNMKITDMWEANIVDSAIVLKNALKIALSLASTALTTGVIIVKPPKSQEEMMQAMLAQQRPW